MLTQSYSVNRGSHLKVTQLIVENVPNFRKQHSDHFE